MSEEFTNEIREQGVKLLSPYLEKIEHPTIKEFVMDALYYVPDSFFYIPASSSGKYHPTYSLGTGGLVRHTMAALYFAEELFPLYNEFTSRQRDYIRAALILHDTRKPSKTHPIEVKFMLEPLRDNYARIFDQVIDLIESHMGQWDYFGKFPTPKSPTQKFVHLCDYLASRKGVSVEIMGRD